MGREPMQEKTEFDGRNVDASNVRAKRLAFLDSLTRPVSPPSNRLTHTKVVRGHEQTQAPNETSGRPVSLSNDIFAQISHDDIHVDLSSNHSSKTQNTASRSLPSPIQLTRIRDLPSHDNVDTISLHDILGDPLIKEAWIFNFCFDVDWMMQHFDPDVKDLVNVKIVHGSWRREDLNKIRIDDACRRRPNADAIQAYLPDAFGTHHSKMFILFRHDDHAQVVIHTANMLAQDWTNMTQAVWRSPLLALSGDASPEPETGIGEHFKHELIRYLKAYGGKLRPLVQQLQLYSFSRVRAALVASVPAKFKLSSANDQIWGYEMLRRLLRPFASQLDRAATSAHLVFQMSSIATLTPAWLEETLYKACGSSKTTTSIVFPAISDVAMSLDGYAAGESIHTKAQKPAHLEQIAAMHSQLCKWTTGAVQSAQAGRDLAAPHIKTYIRYCCKPTVSNPSPAVDWALVTSANLSTQAWGSAPKLAKGEKNRQDAIVQVKSFEIGVLVLPVMFRESTKDADLVTMMPTFKKDVPDDKLGRERTVVGFRMPYDLPLTSYSSDELPWSPQSSYQAPDRHGRQWTSH